MLVLKVLRDRYLCSTCEAFFVYVVGDVSGGLETLEFDA